MINFNWYFSNNSPKGYRIQIILILHETSFFFWMGHMLGHKTSLNKFLKFEIVQNMFSDQSELN